MKKILFLAFTMPLLFAVSKDSQAQDQPKVERKVIVSTDTTVNTDTSIIVIGAMKSGLKGFQTSVYRLTGTAGGVAVIQATINGVDWIPLDTMTLSNQAINTKFYFVTSTQYYSYRLWYKTSTTQTSVPSIAWLRRQDE